jgi:hypothetical protein
MPNETKGGSPEGTPPCTPITPLPMAWVWGLCAGPMPTTAATVVRVRDTDRVGDVVGLGRELMLTCRCSRQRAVCLAALTLVPGVEARLTVGALRRRLRCVACGAAGTEAQIELRDWRSPSRTSRAGG